jgi:hypothetical protein
MTYDTTPDPAFRDGVAAFEWSDWADGATTLGRMTVGVCPHCRHSMALYRRRVRSLTPSPSFTAVCNCVAEHVGRPQGVSQGCGQRAEMDLRGWDPEFDVDGR